MLLEIKDPSKTGIRHFKHAILRILTELQCHMYDKYRFINIFYMKFYLGI
jgi:DNA-binding PadR family transcriptional regulator